MKIHYLILLLLFGCANPSSTENLTYIQISKDDPLSDSPYIRLPDSILVYPQIFQNAYNPGTQYNDTNINCTFYNFDAGKLNVESGKLIAGDPLVMIQAMPFKTKFPKGWFPVQLAMAKMKNDERVAFSRVLFSNSTVTQWEHALLPGQKQIQLTDSLFYCYGVDTGTGVFIDSIANDIAENFDFKMAEHIFIDLAEENHYKGYTYNFNGHNLATFSTGYGDGCYATYIGYNQKGEVCQLLTDFGLIPWWE
jgi:hypothetical protein